MLDRMMVDIAKWIIIILIFFMSFACALFLIYSYFPIVLQQHNTLLQTLSNINSSTSTSTFDYNSTITNNAQCPSYFYELLNQSMPSITDNGDVVDNSNDSAANNDFCQQSSNYGTYQQVGSYPAIYYFGQSFQSTIITTFFTLFGVIGDGTPVSMGS
jgi:predicted PurR-regulated permease PerM